MKARACTGRCGKRTTRIIGGYPWCSECMPDLNSGQLLEEMDEVDMALCGSPGDSPDESQLFELDDDGLDDTDPAGVWLSRWGS